MPAMCDVIHTDFVVIGSGIAGLTTALGAASYGDVTLVTKGALLESNTFFAQGGIAAALGPGDTPEAHSLDTVLAGAEMCEPEAVTILVQHGPARIRDLIALGTRFDTTPTGELAFGREAAHSRPRILHARGDATGAEIATVLARRVREQSNIRILEHTAVIDLITAGGRCIGCWALQPDGRVVALKARAVVVATGGSGQLYRYTTNPWVATGDGPALARRAGAELVDMEFVQFHPTALATAEDPMLLISEAVRGEGAVLVDETGHRFMLHLHPLKELAPRDVVARAIFDKMQQGHQVYLDATRIGPRFHQRFPNITRACLERDIDPVHDLIPVAPAAHFVMGGIATDTCGRTTLAGLYACGEAACTGVHGANRLASNSLLEGLVFSERITRALAAEPPPADAALPPPPPGGPEVRQPESEAELKRIMWEYAGLVRSEAGLRHALLLLDGLARGADPRAYTLRNMLDTARCIVAGALARAESRGGHFRRDYPAPSDAWRLRRIYHRKDRPEPEVRWRDGSGRAVKEPTTEGTT